MATVQFTALIRLPFVRGDFVDPPQADWDATKDRALWKVISKSSKTSELNWAELADRFQVPQTFLLQQAAWLYERHLENVRTQMKKVGSANAPSASGSGSSHTIVGGLPMQRGGSTGSRAPRTASALSVRPRDSPLPRVEASTTGNTFSPAPPSLSRTPSTNTITQSRNTPPNPIRSQPQRPSRPSMTGPRPNPPALPSAGIESQVIDADSPEHTVLSSSSSSSSDSDLQGPAHRSQLFKRPPRFQKQRPKSLLSYDEDPEDDTERSGEVLLPFAQAHSTTSALVDESQHDTKVPLALRNRQGNPSNAQPPSHDRNKRHGRVKSESTDVSSSLASSIGDASKSRNIGPGPLSSKHRAELAKLSPRGKSKKEGSEGTPSMGSSFSDIDDAGISQSALEEALLSNIHAGRMSTLSQLRSRYL